MKNEIKIGNILVSKPFIEDKRFNKTVILITEKTDEGVVGFILNKETNYKTHDFLEKIDGKKFNSTINYGGPVDTNSLFFIHRYPDIIQNSEKINNELCWGGELKSVISGIKSGEINQNYILFFLGYTGWKKGQLEQEIKEGSWILHHIKIREFNTKINWSNILTSIDKEYEIWANAPLNFHLN